MILGDHPTSKVGFHGTASTAQRAGAAQSQIATTALTVSGTFTQSEVQAIVTRLAAATTLVNELQAALAAKGLIKGAA